MARHFPAFIYSHVTDAKSKGHFIVSTLPPKCIIQISLETSDWAKINFKEVNVSGNLVIAILEYWEEVKPTPSDKVFLFSKVKNWINAKIQAGEITLG